MKKSICLLIVVLGLTAWPLFAQSGEPKVKKERPKWLTDQTTVFLIGVPDSLVELIELRAINLIKSAHTPEYQGTSMPKFVIADKKAKATFAIGGFVAFRTAYDFGQIISESTDFVPYLIPTSSVGLNNERFLMSASTSRLYFRATVDTKGGPLSAYIETDFRAAGNSLRLRQAYVSYYGFKVGQAVTTFSDPAGAFNTIDFEGPNGYTYGRNLIVQYTHKWGNGLGVGLAMEYPVVNAIYGSQGSAIYQRVPDIPAYIEYGWGKYGSHIRASGVLRNMYYADNAVNQVAHSVGWGAQLSGSFGVGGIVNLYGQFLVGQGISPYIQDLQGHPYDLRPDRNNAGREVAVGVISWLAGAQFNITSQIPLTIGYSQVQAFDSGGSMRPDDYKIGQYVVGNVFYNISRYWSVGVEYLYGSRINFSGEFAKTQRVQAMVKFNF